MLTAERIAAAERSTFSSVVDQFETDTRIACRSCQRVPPSQHVPSRCARAITARVKALDQGRIVAQGRHERLMAQCALYREPCQKQFLRAAH